MANLCRKLAWLFNREIVPHRLEIKASGWTIRVRFLRMDMEQRRCYFDSVTVRKNVIGLTPDNFHMVNSFTMDLQYILVKSASSAGTIFRTHCSQVDLRFYLRVAVRRK